MCTYRNASLGRIRVESNDPEALMDLGVVVFSILENGRKWLQLLNKKLSQIAAGQITWIILGNFIPRITWICIFTLFFVKFHVFKQKNWKRFNKKRQRILARRWWHKCRTELAGDYRVVWKLKKPNVTESRNRTLLQRCKICSKCLTNHELRNNRSLLVMGSDWYLTCTLGINTPLKCVDSQVTGISNDITFRIIITRRALSISCRKFLPKNNIYEDDWCRFKKLWIYLFSSIALINELAGSHKFAGHVAMIAFFVRT